MKMIHATFAQPDVLAAKQSANTVNSIQIQMKNAKKISIVQNTSRSG